MHMPRDRNLLPEISIALLVLCLYIRTLGFDFVYDDQLAIVQNQLVNSSNSFWYDAIQIFQSPYRPGTLYRPVTTLSYRLNYQFFGLNPGLFHFVNLLLHILAACFVFRLLKPFFSVKSTFFVTALFAIHPVNLEAVVNIVGRAEILALVFGLASLFIFGKCVVDKSISNKHKFGIFAAVLLCLSILSKESALVFVILTPLYYLFLLKNFKFAYYCAYLVLGVIIALVLRFLALQQAFIPVNDSHVFFAANPLINHNFVDRIFPSLQVLGRYISVLLFPLRLVPDYSAAEADFWMATYSWQGVMLATIPLVFISVNLIFRSYAKCLFALWFLVGFGLTCNLFIAIGTIMGERLAYLPSIGLFACITAQVLDFAKRYKLQILGNQLFAGLIILAFFTRAYLHLPIWKNEAVFFEYTASIANRSPKALFNYGLYAFNVEKDYALSAALAETANQLVPTNLESAKLVLNSALADQDIAKAEYWCRKILSVNPNDQEVNQKLLQIEKFKQQIIDAKNSSVAPL